VKPTSVRLLLCGTSLSLTSQFLGPKPKNSNEFVSSTWTSWIVRRIVRPGGATSSRLYTVLACEVQNC
jgi:hypothetical protein